MGENAEQMGENAEQMGENAEKMLDILGELWYNVVNDNM